MNVGVELRKVAYLFRNTFVVSLTAHLLAILLFVIVPLLLIDNPMIPRLHGVVIPLASLSEYKLRVSASKSGGGGGGGDHSKLIAYHGILPKTSRVQLTPPTTHKDVPAPKLAIQETVVAPPMPTKPAEEVGDPNSKQTEVASNGVGGNAGIGSGQGTGIGSGNDSGVGNGLGGGIGGGVYKVGGGVMSPKILDDPDPEYTEEARRVKYQGTVVVQCVVGQDGRIRNARVTRTLGMGLDEKAIEAVKLWRFEPARKDGQAVAVLISIEVNFRLY